MTYFSSHLLIPSPHSQATFSKARSLQANDGFAIVGEATVVDRGSIPGGKYHWELDSQGTFKLYAHGACEYEDNIAHEMAEKKKEGGKKGGLKKQGATEKNGGVKKQAGSQTFFQAARSKLKSRSATSKVNITGGLVHTDPNKSNSRNNI